MTLNVNKAMELAEAYAAALSNMDDAYTHGNAESIKKCEEEHTKARATLEAYLRNSVAEVPA